MAPSTPGRFATHHLTLEDDEDGYEVFFSTASQTVAEGTVNVNVLVSIFPTPTVAASPIVVPIAVDSSVVDIVHASPDDYILPTPSNVIFDATMTEVSFEVIIIDDEVLEDNEIMVLVFDVGSLANVTAGLPDLSRIIITDNLDFRPLFSPKYATLGDALVVNVYPNPVANVLHIALTGVHDYEASLMTLAGVSVLHQKNHASLDVSALTPGVYLLSVSFDDTVVVYRVIRE